MEKDFDTWNVLKKNINNAPETSQNRYFKEREVWWCSLGVNIGDEQDGKNELFERPVLIFRIFNKGLVWIIPLTSKRKAGIYYYSLGHESYQYTLILSQLRLVSAKRLGRKIFTLSSEHFKVVREKMKALM